MKRHAKPARQIAQIQQIQRIQRIQRTQRTQAARQSAFTLIEMMAVLLIIGMLTTFAYPSYRQVKLKAARAEGRTALLRLMQQQERYYSGHHRYRRFAGGDNGDGGGDSDSASFRHFSGATESASAYRLEALACESNASGQSNGASADAPDCLLLRAAPANGFSDPLCDVLTLDSAGKQSATGSTGTDNPHGCW